MRSYDIQHNLTEWALLIRKGDDLELVHKPARRDIHVEHQLIFLQQIAPVLRGIILRINVTQLRNDRFDPLSLDGIFR
jgi:hypothetical protein